MDLDDRRTSKGVRHGEEVVAERVSGDWARCSHGWLPLQIAGVRKFEVLPGGAAAGRQQPGRRAEASESRSRSVRSKASESRAKGVQSKAARTPRTPGTPRLHLPQACEREAPRCRAAGTQTPRPEVADAAAQTQAPESYSLTPRNQEHTIYEFMPSEDDDGRERSITTTTLEAEASGLVPVEAAAPRDGFGAWRAGAAAARRRAESRRAEAQEALLERRASADALAASAAALERRAEEAWRRLEEFREAIEPDARGNLERAKQERELELEASLAEQAAAAESARAAELEAALRAWEDYIQLLEGDLLCLSEAEQRAELRLAEAAALEACAEQKKEELEEQLATCNEKVAALEPSVAADESRHLWEITQQRVACAAERRRVAIEFKTRAEDVGLDAPEELLRRAAEDPSAPQKGRLLIRYAELSLACQALEEKERAAEAVVSALEAHAKASHAGQRAAHDEAVLARQEAEDRFFDASQELVARTAQRRRIEAGQGLPPLPPDRPVPVSEVPSGAKPARVPALEPVPEALSGRSSGLAGTGEAPLATEGRPQEQQASQASKPLLTLRSLERVPGTGGKAEVCRLTLQGENKLQDQDRKRDPEFKPRKSKGKVRLLIAKYEKSGESASSEAEQVEVVTLGESTSSEEEKTGASGGYGHKAPQDEKSNVCQVGERATAGHESVDISEDAERVTTVGGENMGKGMVIAVGSENTDMSTVDDSNVAAGDESMNVGTVDDSAVVVGGENMDAGMVNECTAARDKMSDTREVSPLLLGAGQPEDAPRVEIGRSTVRVVAPSGVEASFSLPEGTEPMDEVAASGRMLQGQGRLVVSWPCCPSLDSAEEPPVPATSSSLPCGAGHPEGIVHEGWVAKQSQHTGVWRRRWMVLHSDGGIKCFQDQSRFGETASFQLLGGATHLARGVSGPIVLAVTYPSKWRTMLGYVSQGTDSGKATSLAFDAGTENERWLRALREALPEGGRAGPAA